ncbi:hypothetical protein AAG906_040809 [Vitis piasezkii]
MDSENVDGVAHDLVSLLTREDRDFLVRNNGHQVKVESLKGKKIWLYFSASWFEAYNELSSNDDFEIIFVSGDKDDESFNGYFSKMPWLMIPFSDSDARDQLNELFKVMGIPNLVMLDESGKVLSEDGVEIIQEYGVEAYPFTPEKIKEMKEKEETARKEQSLRSILVSQSRDYVISTDGKKVPVSELEGKFVGLYFSLSSYKACLEFTPTLVDVYEKLRAKGESFEISCEKLARYFELSALPTLVVIGPDGKTLHSNVAEAIEDHGIQAYPFTPEKFAELEEIEKAKREAQTLESILVSGDRDFVIGKDGVKVRSAFSRCVNICFGSCDKLLLFQIPVSDLVGKHPPIFLSTLVPPCRSFLPKLIEAYQKIKAKDEAFEVIFISSDRDQSSFDEFFSGLLSRTFKVYGIPSLIAIGPTGRTVTTEARSLVMIHGADAYPFTDERVKEIQAQYEEMPKGWPESYICDRCDDEGHLWSFYCAKCDFDLHPKCALEEDQGSKDDEEKASPGEGWKCDGKCVPSLS